MGLFGCCVLDCGVCFVMLECVSFVVCLIRFGAFLGSGYCFSLGCICIIYLFLFGFVLFW